jgi:hypothetical protein
MPDYARIAYDAWAAAHHWQHLNTQVIVPFDSQPQAIKDAWAAAADAVLHAPRPEDAP